MEGISKARGSQIENQGKIKMLKWQKHLLLIELK